MADRSGSEQWNSAAEIQGLSRKKFGKKLAHRLARALTAAAKSRHIEKRALINSHRDYCGHGLIYLDGNFHLLEVNDGLVGLLDVKNDTLKPAGSIVSWDDELSFSDFWSRQSDFTCSGADPDAPVFHETTDWSLNNQRITRRRILEFIAQHE